MRRLPAVVAVLCVSSISAALSAEGPLDRTEIEKLLAEGKAGEIKEAFIRNSDHVFDYVDQYLEGGLAAIEERGDREEADYSFDLGRKFAKLADEAFDETIFSDYAGRFTWWDEAEQRRFREGQEHYRQAKQHRAKGVVDRMLDEHRRSYELAKPLGDRWGVGMNAMGIGLAHTESEQFADALDPLNEAIDILQRLQLRQHVIYAKCVLGQALLGLRRYDEAYALMVQTQAMVRPGDDPALIADVPNTLERARYYRDERPDR